MTLKTVETNKDVDEVLNLIEDTKKRQDTEYLIKLISKITKKKAKVWGDNSMIGFGKYKYQRKGKKEEYEWFNIGLAPRKNNITLYLTCYLDSEPLIKKLGKCKFGKGCLYIKKLEDIDLEILKKLIEKYKENKWYS